MIISTRDWRRHSVDYLGGVLAHEAISPFVPLHIGMKPTS